MRHNAHPHGSNSASPARILRTVNATRYVTPLREGGSLPAIIEADDQGMYVLKFRGAVTFDPVVEHPDVDLASSIVWFDALVTNVDRTPRNTNMLMWHRRLWLIDHGAALFFHHAWDDWLARSTAPFALIKDHVLLPLANRVAEVGETLAARLDSHTIDAIVENIPAAWLGGGSPFADHREHRDAYATWLKRRRDASRTLVEEAIRARARHL
jgi:hypothetical protein